MRRKLGRQTSYGIRSRCRLDERCKSARWALAERVKLTVEDVRGLVVATCGDGGGRLWKVGQSWYRDGGKSRSNKKAKIQKREPGRQQLLSQAIRKCRNKKKKKKKKDF